MVVKKKNGKNHICIDFTDINKACPKDSFPLPHINSLVDSTVGHELMNFMDAYFGYNQILIHPEDQKKTAFITGIGIYYFKVMSFGIKIVGSTYQCLVNKMFIDFIGNTMVVYIDDTIVKSLKKQDHLDDLCQAFGILRIYDMNLNPAKCSFGVTSGKFLSYLVTKRGIEANRRQINAVENIQSLKCIKDVQKLTGRLATLIRFISKYFDKSHFF